jgi:hypothetical protein
MLDIAFHPKLLQWSLSIYVIDLQLGVESRTKKLPSPGVNIAGIAVALWLGKIFSRNLKESEILTFIPRTD